MGRINEEACDDAIPELCLLPKDVYELTGRHCKVNLLRITKYINRADIWHFHLDKGILFTHQVIEVMDVRVDSELIDLLCIVQDEI